MGKVRRCSFLCFKQERCHILGESSGHKINGDINSALRELIIKSTQNPDLYTKPCIGDRYMKIARIIRTFQPKFGYAEYYLLKELQRQGHEVCVITSDHYSNEVTVFDGSINPKVGSGRFVEYGLDVYRLPSLFGSGRFLYSQGLRKVLTDVAPDIVHSNDLFYSSTLLSAHYKGKFGYRFFVDSITGTFNPFGLNSVAFSAYRFLFKHYLRKNADGFIAIAEGSKKWLFKNFYVPLSSINDLPLGADDKLFIPVLKIRKMMRENLGIMDDEIAIIYTGKLLPEKDIDLLIRSVGILLHDFKGKLKLIIVGNGSKKYVTYLNTLIQIANMSKNVVFIPTVDRNELPKYYNAADIAIWPGVPSISIIEAMSTGLPVIIAGYEKPREDAYDTSHLLNNNNGLSFQRGNLFQLSSCMRTLASDNNLRNNMGLRSRAFVEEKLSWVQITKQLLKIYESTL